VNPSGVQTFVGIDVPDACEDRLVEERRLDRPSSAGESVEELFHFERVPVPWGFVVQVHQRLPARLATESRHVVGAAVSMRRVTLSRPVHRTPRGDYRIPPASVAFTDLFGLTRVAIAQAAEAAGLKAQYLPAIAGQITSDHGAAMTRLLAELPAPVLAYCRSGARSTSLWQLARSQP
jgi:uncharacterized protein (DUF58 family)